jgi:hypothetical protein
MIHENTECCGWVSYPASQDEHICENDTITTPNEGEVFLVMNADFTDDSDY